MSREAAATELTKEIDRLGEEIRSLTRLRDEILAGQTPISEIRQMPARKSVAKKSPAKKAAPANKSAVKKAAPAPAKKKRVLSPEGRKRIIEATKRFWAQKRKDKAASKAKQ